VQRVIERSDTIIAISDRTKQDRDPQQALVFSKGRVGSFIGNGWEWPYALDPKQGNPSLASKIGAYPMPKRSSVSSASPRSAR
jgi:ABC-type glycerol-3-phosphate transport system substrate-binding protein